MKPLLTKEAFEAYREKKLVIDNAKKKIRIDEPDFPESALSLLIKAEREGWLSQEGVSKHLLHTLYPRIAQKELDEAPAHEAVNMVKTENLKSQIFVKESLSQLLAGACCTKGKDQLIALQLVQEMCGGAFNTIMDFRMKFKDLEEHGHTPIRLRAMPLSLESYVLYHDLIEIDDGQISEVIQSDSADAFGLLMQLQPSLKKRNELKGEVDKVEWRECQAIRQYLYDEQLSSPDEDAYGRISALFKAAGGAQKLTIKESEIPVGFFDRYGHELWYEVLAQLDQSNQTTSMLSRPEHRSAIRERVKCLGMLMQKADFYPALMAITSGRNLASLSRYRQVKEQPRQDEALAQMIDLLSDKVYCLYQDGDLVAKDGGFAGQISGYYLARAVTATTPSVQIEPLLSRDCQRIMFYRVTGKQLYLRNLEDSSLGDKLITQDLGL